MIEHLLDKAEREFVASTRRLSPALYTADGNGKVVPYERAGNGQVATKIRIAHEKLAIHEYENQRSLLDRMHADCGKDVFVASYTSLTSPSGEVESLGVWTRGIPTYLPRTQWIVLVVPLGKGTKVKRTIKLPFKAVEDRLRPLPYMHPARYETGTFPTDTELTALEAAAGKTLEAPST